MSDKADLDRLKVGKPIEPKPRGFLGTSYETYSQEIIWCRDGTILRHEMQSVTENANDKALMLADIVDIYTVDGEPVTREEYERRRNTQG